MIITADWVLPIASPPIHHGFVAVEAGRIAAVGRQEDLPAYPPHPRPLPAGGEGGGEGERLHLHNHALLPGLVNLHTHLDYSHMAGMPDDLGFSDWIQRLSRRAAGWTPEHWLASARHGVGEMLRTGVTCVADSGYSGASLRALGESGLRGVVGAEIFGRLPEMEQERLGELQERVNAWRAIAAPLVQVGVAPHSPYTVLPSLWHRVTTWASEQGMSVQCHLAESQAEAELVASGTGPLRDFLAGFGQERLYWEPRGQSPVAHIAAAGGLADGILVAHCIQVDDADLAILKQHGAAVAHCPRSNARLGCGRAPLARIVAAGLPWGLGTDSAASGSPISMWEEMRFALGIHRAVGGGQWAVGSVLNAETILEQVTLGAARALGWASEIGSLEAGKAADLIAVALPPGSEEDSPAHDLYAALVYTVQEAELVMVAGQIVHRKGESHSLDH